MSTEANAQIVSFIGGCRRTGRWLVPQKTTVLTLFGRATIDLREAQTSAEELAFECTNAFASITFIVPEGAEVRPSGIAVLASSRSDVPVTPGGSHLPKISIDATTALGRFRIVTASVYEQEARDKLEKKAEKRAEKKAKKKRDRTRAKEVDAAADHGRDEPPVEVEVVPMRAAQTEEPADTGVDLPPVERADPRPEDRSPLETTVVPADMSTIDDVPAPLPEPMPMPDLSLDDVPAPLPVPEAPAADAGSLDDVPAPLPEAEEPAVDTGSLDDVPAPLPEPEEPAADAGSAIHVVKIPDTLRGVELVVSA